MRATAAICLAAMMLLGAGTTAADPTPGNSVKAPVKDSTPTGVATYEGRDQGDTVEDPFVIDGLVFYDSGLTCPFSNDYDEACPYDGSDSPDVVYRYDAPYNSTVVIDLCLSDYDTKVYVYENEVTPGWPLACNDDYAGCGPSGYRSWLMTEFTGGNTYYIVIDGYGGDCGLYDLYMHEYQPCVGCPTGAFVEPEPFCIDPWNDIDNGGCNSDPPIFDYLEPSEGPVNVCGTSGTYVDGYDYIRDTDWYQIDLASEAEISLRCIANFNVRLGIVDGREGCEGVSTFYSYVDAWTCYAAILNEVLVPGTWWIWVGPSEFSGVPCGEEYVFELTGYTPVTPVERMSWTTLKALYRSETP